MIDHLNLLLHKPFMALTMLDLLTLVGAGISALVLTVIAVSALFEIESRG